MNKVDNIQKSLRFALNDFISNYEAILQKTNNCTVEFKRWKLLALGTSGYKQYEFRICSRSVFEKK